jgi:hypothetical protein
MPNPFLSVLFSFPDIIDPRITEPFKTLAMIAYNTFMGHVSGLVISFATFLHHAMPALITDIVHFKGLYWAFYLGHAVLLEPKDVIPN